MLGAVQSSKLKFRIWWWNGWCAPCEAICVRRCVCVCVCVSVWVPPAQVAGWCFVSAACKYFQICGPKGFQFCYCWHNYLWECTECGFETCSMSSLLVRLWFLKWIWNGCLESLLKVESVCGGAGGDAHGKRLVLIAFRRFDISSTMTLYPVNS